MINLKDLNNFSAKQTKKGAPLKGQKSYKSYKSDRIKYKPLRVIGLAQGLPLLYQKDLEDLKDFSAKQTKKRLKGVPLWGRNLTNLTNLTELNISLLEASA